MKTLKRLQNIILLNIWIPKYLYKKLGIYEDIFETNISIQAYKNLILFICLCLFLYELDLLKY